MAKQHSVHLACQAHLRHAAAATAPQSHIAAKLHMNDQALCCGAGMFQSLVAVALAHALQVGEAKKAQIAALGCGNPRIRF